MRTFEPARIGGVELRNRLLRAATFEGLADQDGKVTPAYERLYARLAELDLGGLITGFAYVSQDGKAMQPGQAGIDSEGKVEPFRAVTRSVHERGCRIFLQLAHAGRQTCPAVTDGRIYAPSPIRSRYFKHRPTALTEPQIERIISDFAQGAGRARDAGFDGVELHAAHGYLIHQFLHPAMNQRTDPYGIDRETGIGTAFLDRVIEAVRRVCGADYPLLVKISAGDKDGRSQAPQRLLALVQSLDAKHVDAIEVSYGTMDEAFNIFRAASIPAQAILAYNPRYSTGSRWRRAVWTWLVLPILRRRFLPFSPMYNLAAAGLVKRHTSIPVISVGGFRSGPDIRTAIEEEGIDFVSLSRPLLCEPDFAVTLRQDAGYQSRCRNCNRCAVMCDSGFPTRCYRTNRCCDTGEEGDSRTPPPHHISKLSAYEN